MFLRCRKGSHGVLPSEVAAGARASASLALLLAFVAAIAAVGARAAAQELTILRYEPLADFTITESGDAAAPNLQISFVAFATPFAMTLTRNEALTSRLPPDVLARVA